jgi:uncharacterized membrane protein
LKLRTVAAALSLINGIWIIAVGAYWNQLFSLELGDITCAGSCLFGVDHIVLVLGAILLVDSLVCFLAFSRAFYISAALSVLVLFFVLFSVWAAILSIQAWENYPAIPVSILLGIATMVLDVIAANRKTYVSEENHPLNLPVFG